MAKKKSHDAAAAKAKKQKLILAVAGVAMLGLAAIQGPKLMKQLNPPAAKPVAAVTSSSATAPITAPATVKASGPRSTAILAGVTVQGDGSPTADEGQLRSFSLFETKDPFVPQASDEPLVATVATAQPTLSGTQPAGAGGTAANPVVAPPALAPTDATITMNGKAFALTVKEEFPKLDPLFVLRSLKPKAVKIAVAGGTFDGGKTIELKLGKQITLVNGATGARYVLKLVYTGAQPEQTESFTQAKR